MMNESWIALRRTLPEWCFEELASELVEEAVKSRINEVIIKVDVEEFSHGHPDPEWLRGYCVRLKDLRDQLRKYGICCSLNPWITIGHADRGRDERSRIPGFQGIVGADGITCRHCACPLCEAWRQRDIELWQIYASVRPRAIWVEDDLRTFNHEPVKFGCFCPNHMARFSSLAGRTVTREELVEALLAPGEPHPWRKLFLDMQSAVTRETAAILTAAVHRIDRNIIMGVMSSGPRLHCAEGRDWTTLAQTFADGGPLFSRPTIGMYNEGSLRDFYFAQDSIKLTRAVLPPETKDYTEVENYPYSAYANSGLFTFLKAAVSFAFGASGIAANLYNHLGSSIKTDHEALSSLIRNREFLNSLARINTEYPAEFRGVRVLFHAEEASRKHLDAQSGLEKLFSSGYDTVFALEGCGIPTTYSPMPVSVLTGETARCFSDEELMDLFRQGLMLDGAAADILIQRGFGKFIGISSMGECGTPRELGEIFSCEEIPLESEHKVCYTTCTLFGKSGPVRFYRPVSAGAEPAAWFVDCDRQHTTPSLLYFTNALGGRVAVHALGMENAASPTYFSPERKIELQNIIRFLSNDAPEFLADPGPEAWPLAWRKSGEKSEIIGCFNLSLNTWNGVHFQLRRTSGTPRFVMRLHPDGKWRTESSCSVSRSNRTLHIEVNHPIDCQIPLVLQVFF